MSEDKTEEKKETKVGGSGEFCKRQVWMGDESGGNRRRRREGRVNGERSISPRMMRGRQTLSGQI